MSDIDELDDLLDDFADEILDKPFEENEDNAETEAKLTEQIESEMANIFGDAYKDPETKAGLDKLMGKLAESFDAPEEGIPEEKPKDFKNVISSTMNRLKEQDAKVERSIAEENASGDDLLAGLLKNMDLGDLSAGLDLEDKDLDILLLDMVSLLTSKETLYEPLKDLSYKLPVYIEENQDNSSVSKEDLDRYKGQLLEIKLILSEFDNPEYDESKPECRDRVSKMLEKLHEWGMPPDELVEKDSSLNFGAEEVNGCATQ